MGKNPQADRLVQIVGDPEDADFAVQVVGDQVVDTSGASSGDLLEVQDDGSLLAVEPYFGKELAYAEQTTEDTTTNTTYSDAALAANKIETNFPPIAPLACTVVGEGRLVQVEFFCPVAYNELVNASVNAVLLINGSAVGGQIGSVTSPSNANGSSLSLRRRLLLTDGVSYTFHIGKLVQAGGGTEGHYLAGAADPMSLSVVGR